MHSFRGLCDKGGKAREGERKNERSLTKYGRRNAQKIKQRSSKSLQNTSLCYSNAKSTLLVSLTFKRVEKTNHNFNFVHPLSSSSSPGIHVTRKVYTLCKY